MLCIIQVYSKREPVIVKRLIKLFAIFFILLLFCFGCQQQKSEKSEKIPFLLFCNSLDNPANVSTKIAKWDLITSKITVDNEAAYITDPNISIDDVRPIYWDGGDKFVVMKGCNVGDKFKNTTEVFSRDRSSRIIWGENIKLIQKFGEKGKIYEFEFYKDGKKVTQKVDLNYLYKSNGKKELIGDNELVHSIAFDGTTISTLFSVMDENNEIIFLNAKYSIQDKKLVWENIKLGKDCGLGPGLEPLPLTSMRIKNNYYFGLCNGIGKIDLDNRKYFKFDQLEGDCMSVVKGLKENPMPREITIIGKYNDFLILDVPVYTGKGFTTTNYESLFCAIKDGKVVGSLYLVNDIIQVYDKNKKMISKTDLKGYQISKCPKIYFPRTSNEY